MKSLLLVIIVAVLSIQYIFSAYGCSKELDYPSEVSLKEANKIVGEELPFPSYLPENFEVDDIYALEHSDYSETFAVTFFTRNTGIHDVTRIDEAPVRMYIALLREGQIGGLKIPGKEYDIEGTRGILWTREESNELWWILPYHEFPGQYELSIRANKDVPEDEIVRMARSVPQNNIK